MGSFIKNVQKETTQNNNGYQRAGAAYAAKSKKGTDYVKIMLDNGERFFMFPNEKKQKETDPDFFLTKGTN
jgi:hypothetical protein